MKIDIIIPVAKSGGVENCINILCGELMSLGHDIRVIQLITEGDKWINENVEFYELTYGKVGHDTDELASAYKSFLDNHGICDVAIATNWPLCVYIVKSAIDKLSINIPVVSWLHNPVERYIDAGYGGYECLELADAHLAISNYIYTQINNNINNRRIYRVNNPIDKLCHVCFKRDNQKINNKIGFVGRITPVKGLDIILKSMSFISSKWKLEVFGEFDSDEYKIYVKELITELRLENRVTFHGWISCPWTFFSDIDFLCMPSIYEGFPLTALEALSNGIPIIATPVSGITELIEEGKNGYLVPQQDYKAIANLLNGIESKLIRIPQAYEYISILNEYKSDIAAKDFERALNNIIINSNC